MGGAGDAGVVVADHRLGAQAQRLIVVVQAERLYAACGSKEKELKIFTVEDGGSQHCIFDNLPMISNFIADWWMDRLVKR